MDVDNLVRMGANFFYRHTYISIAFLIAIVIFACMKPKQVFKVAVFALVIGVIFYIISLLNASMFSGVEHEDKILKKSHDAIESMR